MDEREDYAEPGSPPSTRRLPVEIICGLVGAAFLAMMVAFFFFMQHIMAAV